MRGRPRKQEEKAKHRIAARLTDEELALLEKNRQLLNMSKSDFLREAMIYYAEIVNKDKNKKVINA